MADDFSEETKRLFAAADDAIENAHKLIAERRRMVSDAEFFRNKRTLLQYADRAKLLHALHGKK